MSPKRNSVPLYQRHSSGRARVRTYDANGKRIEIVLPGEYGSEESKAEYARVVAQLAVGNGSLPVKASHDCTISELVFKYMAHAESYYVDPVAKARTSEQAAIMEACRPLRRLFGPLPVNDFDFVCLEAIQEAMATGSTWTDEEREKKTRHNRPIGMARTTINRHIDRIKRIMRWGCAKKIVHADNLVNIESVASLKAGRTNARETKIVKPVDPAIVDLTLPHMTPTPADMVGLMLLSGCRVGELCRLKGCELDRTGPEWVYVPDRHKTAHRGHIRNIVFGPQAQLILRKYLKADPDAFLFSPAEQDRVIKEQKRAARNAIWDDAEKVGFTQSPLWNAFKKNLGGHRDYYRIFGSKRWAFWRLPEDKPLSKEEAHRIIRVYRAKKQAAGEKTTVNRVPRTATTPDGQTEGAAKAKATATKGANGTGTASPAAQTIAAGISKIDQAIVIIVREPNLSLREVARRVNCSPGTLSDSKDFRRARDQAQGVSQASIPKGSKKKDGTVEADDYRPAEGGD